MTFLRTVPVYVSFRKCIFVMIAGQVPASSSYEWEEAHCAPPLQVADPSTMISSSKFGKSDFVHYDTSVEDKATITSLFGLQGRLLA